MIQEKRKEELISNMGFKELNPTQLLFLDSQSKNKILISETGSGKTFAFLLSAVDYCDNHPEKIVLILVPSRELSSQIESVFRNSKSGYNITCCYGGHSVRVEKRSLEYLPRIIIGTPGRVLDHLASKTIDASSVGLLIFDEFDKLLEFGFDDEMSQITSRLSNVENRILSSATKSDIYPNYISQHTFDTIENQQSHAAGRMNHWKVYTHSHSKLEVLHALICRVGHEPTIVFCNFREVSEEVSDYLYDNFVENEFFHGGMEQFDREKALLKFRNGSCNVLLSTDLVARGIDISDVKNIIHYHVPSSQDSYIHRNGRTARVDKSGDIYLIIDSAKPSVPEYVNEISVEVELDYTNLVAPHPKYTSIYFGMGKKDKLSKVDIVGFLCQKGGLSKSDIGVIELKDYHSFAAVKFELAKETLKNISTEKIKGKRTKMALSK